jgi:hypothetical protein
MRQVIEGTAHTGSGTRIGYVRVSTVAQTLDQQEQALAAAGVSKTFSDIMSGARDDRPGLIDLMSYVRRGDTVVVWKLDRLGRNLWHVRADVPGTIVPTRQLLDAAECPSSARHWVILPAIQRWADGGLESVHGLSVGKN